MPKRKPFLIENFNFKSNNIMCIIITKIHFHCLNAASAIKSLIPHIIPTLMKILFPLPQKLALRCVAIDQIQVRCTLQAEKSTDYPSSTGIFQTNNQIKFAKCRQVNNKNQNVANAPRHQSGSDENTNNIVSKYVEILI